MINFHFYFIAKHRMFEIARNYNPGLNPRQFHLSFKYLFLFYFGKILEA